MGHEFSGTVSAVGEGVTDVTVGEHVVVEPYFVCGVCAPCREGRYNLCTSMGFIGLAGGGGGLSEKIVVDRRWVHPVGDIPLDEAARITVETVRSELDVSPTVEHVIFALRGAAPYEAFKTALNDAESRAAGVPS